VPLLLEIVPEVKRAGRMPEPFTAHNEEEVHGTTTVRGLWDFFQPIKF
jgi:hypothetical protein